MAQLDVNQLYVLRNKETEQVTGIFLYKDEEEAVMHTEYAYRQHFLEEKDMDNAKQTEIVLVGEMDLKTGMTAGKTPKVVFKGSKYIAKLEKEAENKNDENKE